MVLSIPALLILILLTPNLLGRPQELASIPLLVVGLTQNESEILVDVSGAVQRYMYEVISLQVVSRPAPDVNLSLSENDTYGLNARIPTNETLVYDLHVWLQDRQANYFEYNVTMAVYHDENGDAVMAFVLIDEDSPRTVRIVAPDDFRWALPRRGEV